jgi:hypothetical protein
MHAAARAWGNDLLALSLFGTICMWIARRRQALGSALLLLWLPVPFYAYSVAYGSVPIFLPAWWPHSWYNLRYGMELLPALALGLGFASHLILSAVERFRPRSGNRRWTYATIALFLAVVGDNAIKMISEKPLVYVEGTKNIDAHRPYQQQIPPVLRALLTQHPGNILMDTSIDPEIIALTGITLRQTINESDLEVFRDALADPAAHASIVVAYDADDIDRAVHAHPQGLTEYRRFRAAYQPPITIYVSDKYLEASGLNKDVAAVIASGKEIQ